MRHRHRLARCTDGRSAAVGGRLINRLVRRSIEPESEDSANAFALAQPGVAGGETDPRVCSRGQMNQVIGGFFLELRLGA